MCYRTLIQHNCNTTTNIYRALIGIIKSPLHTYNPNVIDRWHRRSHVVLLFQLSVQQQCENALWMSKRPGGKCFKADVLQNLMMCSENNPDVQMQIWVGVLLLTIRITSPAPGVVFLNILSSLCFLGCTGWCHWPSAVNSVNYPDNSLQHSDINLLWLHMDEILVECGEITWGKFWVKNSAADVHTCLAKVGISVIFCKCELGLYRQHIYARSGSDVASLFLCHTLNSGL